MSETLKKLKGYRDTLFGDLAEIPVDEIGEAWYTSKHVTLRDFRRIFAIGNEADKAVETVLVLAKDSQGKRLFTDSNKSDLEVLPPQMVVRISREIWGHVEIESVEDAEKKS